MFVYICMYIYLYIYIYIFKCICISLIISKISFILLNDVELNYIIVINVALTIAGKSMASIHQLMKIATYLHV